MLPECGEGEADRDLSMTDRSTRPRLTANAQTVPANCNRPLEIEDWREMTSERQLVALELMGFAHWQKVATTEVGEGKVVSKQVSPKPPRPKAPTTYWEDPKGGERSRGWRGSRFQRKGVQREGFQRK